MVMESNMPVDAASALALVADLYRQVTEARQQLADTTAALVELRAATREDAGVPTT